MVAFEHPDVIEVASPGLRASLQDLGHGGWRRFGVPPGGAMDSHAAAYANRLLDNPDSAPVLEMLLQGGQLRVLRDTWVAVTGADSGVELPMWRAVQVREGDELNFPRNQNGVWIYVAVEHGFESSCRKGNGTPPWAGLLGRPLQAGDLLRHRPGLPFGLPTGVAGRVVDPIEQWNFSQPPPFRVWPGPQWDAFAEEGRQHFFSSAWEVTPQSDRAGYRLSGPPMPGTRPQMLSEPTLVGSIQIPDDGQPIVTMRDGPTVGGYPKLGVVDPDELSRLTQCRPGQTVTFVPVA